MAAAEEQEVSMIQTPDDNRRISLVKEWKNAAIGSWRQKETLIQQNVVAQLVTWLDEEDGGADFLTDVAVVLGSLARGKQEIVNSLVEARTVQVLLKSLLNGHRTFVEACLRCVRAIFQNADHLSSKNVFTEPTALSVLLNVANTSACCQECVAIVLARLCQIPAYQNALLNAGAVETMAPLLFSGLSKVQRCAVDFYASLCYCNYRCALTVANFVHMGRPLIDQFVAQMSRSNPMEMQITAAKCLANICRAGALLTNHNIITLKVMPTLVRGCIGDTILGSSVLRVESCDALSYLIEEDVDLQQLTSWNNQCLRIMNTCLNGAEVGADDPKLAEDLQAGALAVIAALASNHEDIRKKVVNELPNLLDHIACNLNSNEASAKLVIASIKCLLALSRSVEQLRTTFLDRQLWRRLLPLIQHEDEEIVVTASAVLANLVLEFSPNKAPLLDAGCVEILCDLAQREEQSLRLNGVWGLMNLAFQSDEKVKQAIVSKLSPEQLLRLLTETAPDSPVVLRLLGLLRNLLFNKADIDRLMSSYGTSVIQAIIFVLEGDYSAESKEQALCVLSNIADGDSAKEFIMSNEDVLRKITNYMVHKNTKLQVAAVSCICNLVWKDRPGCIERQAKLRDLGVNTRLQQLLQQQKHDADLYDKVKTALLHLG